MTNEEKENTKTKKTRSGVSRREFITGTVGGVVVGAVVGAVAGSSAFPKTVTQTVTQTATQTQTQTQTTTLTPSAVPSSWDLTADVVIIGAGGAGLPASLAAQANGASVLVVDANYDIGGRSILSSGYVHLGGGNPGQTAAGVVDSPDLVFQDLTDWTIVEANGWPDYRYNDPGFIRAFADNMVATYNLLVANGLKWTNGPYAFAGLQDGNSVFRTFQPNQSTGPGSIYSPNSKGGTSYARPLEASARSKGVKFLLNYRMTNIIRETIFPAPSGKVLGVVAQYTGGRTPAGSTTPLKSYADTQGLQGNINMTQATVNIKANKGVIIATGGHTSNVDFRRIFDPRLTQHMIHWGEPYVYNDGRGELAAMDIGASLWGAANAVLELGIRLTYPSVCGILYNYNAWDPTSPMLPFTGGIGISVANKQDVIYVNQTGQRFYDETKSAGYPYGNTSQSWYPSIGTSHVSPYTPDSYLNNQYISSSTPPGTPFDGTTWGITNAALAVNSASVAPDFSAGPVWTIFDSDAVTREKWTVAPPYVDTANGYFFSANTLTDLAAALSKNKYQTTPMNGATLQATVTRYNSFVDSGVDSDFGKPKPLYKIQTPPFYAGWNSPTVHDSRVGLRINMKMQVVDRSGQVIPHLYCAGESAGGISEHGLGRCSAGGYIAATNAVLETPIT